MSEAEVNKIVNSGQPIKRSYWNMVYLVFVGVPKRKQYPKKYRRLNYVPKHVAFAEILLIEIEQEKMVSITFCCNQLTLNVNTGCCAM